ncbi:hypothetical protein [Pseudolactococcus paracarnosus]|uniref:hypothetical protein n=1 Tax=Pseudolactococcus paracarnosus TaxID=2749962 RepID=UPI001FBA4C4C|nr:hypothetical protein [Lactococcus paracarnosus]
MKKIINYLPSIFVIVGFLLVSFGVYTINKASGYIVSGLLLFVLSYMFSSKGD